VLRRLVQPGEDAGGLLGMQAGLVVRPAAAGAAEPGLGFHPALAHLPGMRCRRTAVRAGVSNPHH